MPIFHKQKNYIYPVKHYQKNIMEKVNLDALIRREDFEIDGNINSSKKRNNINRRH